MSRGTKRLPVFVLLRTERAEFFRRTGTCVLLPQTQCCCPDVNAGRLSEVDFRDTMVFCPADSERFLSSGVSSRPGRCSADTPGNPTNSSLVTKLKQTHVKNQANVTGTATRGGLHHIIAEHLVLQGTHVMSIQDLCQR